MTLKNESAYINKFFARACAVVGSLTLAGAICFARSSGLTSKDPLVSESTAKIRSNRSSEKNGLNRHRMNKELIKRHASGVEHDLMQSLKNDPDVVVRQGAAQSLGNYVRRPFVVKYLSDALSIEKEPGVRYACVSSLSLSDSPQAMAALEKLVVDPDVKLRRQLAYVCKLQNNPRAQNILKKLQSDSDALVRLRAMGQ